MAWMSGTTSFGVALEVAVPAVLTEKTVKVSAAALTA